MFTKLFLNDFRIFKNQTIELSETLTSIAGQNATGKSTILSILGNSCEIKPGAGKTITGKAFHTEFSEIVKGSKEYDKKSGNIGTLYYTSTRVSNYEIDLRVAWQKKNEKASQKTRFRIIPKRKDLELDKITESKFPVPSFYLGLSRLYPLGETDSEKIEKLKLNLSDDDYNWLYKNYQDILSLNNIEINSVSNYKIDNKISGGINTDKYDYLTNSCGQDNLMQILYILFSFKKLYDSIDKQLTPWLGGIFLIDEIDATLHPAAQIRLIDLMYNICKEIHIQIIFTTHSLQILNYISQKRNYKKDIGIVYLTTANNTLQIKTNPNYELMENDMLISDYYSNIKSKQIVIYSEDEEARWFIKKILKGYLDRINLIEIKLGGESLLDLLYNDRSYFKNVLFVLDGDKDIGTTKYKDLPNLYCNILTLPGKTSPEELIYMYLSNLPADHEILETFCDKGVTLRLIQEEGPLRNAKYACLNKNREKYKQWFNDKLVMLEDIDVFSFWKRDNPNEYQEFIDTFINKYNIVASKNNLPKIR